MKGQKIELRIGGETWAGWHFGPYGRARDWRLHAPNGEHFTAGELADLRALQRDVDYLTTRVRELERRLSHRACYFSPDEQHALNAAVAILTRELPAVTRRYRAALHPAPQNGSTKIYATP